MKRKQSLKKVFTKKYERALENSVLFYVQNKINQLNKGKDM